MSNKVTAGRDKLGKFAPQFAAFNDDVLFGEVCQENLNFLHEIEA